MLVKKNILIIGFGSIGQRHYRNLKKIFKNKINFFLLRKIYKVPLLSENNRVKKNQKNLTNTKNILKSLSEIKKKNLKIDAAFICTPSSIHIHQLIWLLKNNINTFVEKPLSNDLKKIHKLKNILKKTSAISMIGYQMRFNPIIKFLCNENNYKKVIGKLNYAEIYNGEDVRNFHSWEDYRKSYTSKKHLGGGVTLSQIHEFDYFNLLFQKYKIIKSKSMISKVSNFEIDVDDTSSHLFKLKKNKENVICSLHLNFYENPKKRIIRFIGEKGSLEADLNNNKIKFLTNNKIKIKKFKFKRNDLFKDEIKYFFNCINLRKKKHDLDLSYAIENLKFVLKLKS